MDQDQPTPVHAIRSLTIAVWTLVVVVLVNASLIVCIWVLPMFFRPHTISYSYSGPASATGPDFHELPAAQKIAKATTILVTEYRPDGDRMKPVITDIVKQPSGSQRYEIGSEFAEGGYYLGEDDVHFGKGQVIFFTDGDESNMRYAAGYDEHDRVIGLDYMPLKKLKELAGKPDVKP